METGPLDTTDDQGPTIEFENFAVGQALAPGQDLVAVVEDSSGVNVLGSVAANSILADFDESSPATDEDFSASTEASDWDYRVVYDV